MFLGTRAREKDFKARDIAKSFLGKSPTRLEFFSTTLPKVLLSNNKTEAFISLKNNEPRASNSTKNYSITDDEPSC